MTKSHSIKWSEKHKPKKLDEMILSDSLKSRLQSLISNKHNATIYGPTGIGKSTFCDILKSIYDATTIDCSDIKGIEGIKEHIIPFDKKRKLLKSYKYIIIEDADKLSEKEQMGLKDTIEQLKDNARIILITTNLDKIIQSLQSLCKPIWFGNDMPKSMIFCYCNTILEAENKQVDDLNGIIEVYYPNIKSIIDELQNKAM